MRLIAISNIKAFAAANPGAAAALNHWVQAVKAATWSNMNDVRVGAPSAKVINGERARFEVAGGKFRLIAAFDFDRSLVFVKFIGTHTEYDQVDALTVSMF